MAERRKKRKRDYSAIVARRRRTIAWDWVLSLPDSVFDDFIRSVRMERLHRTLVRKAIAGEINKSSVFWRGFPKYRGPGG